MNTRGTKAELDSTKLSNLARLYKLIDESDLDAIVATSLENVAYTSGFYNAGLRQEPNRLHIAIWPKGGQPVFVVPQYNLDLDSFIQDRRGYDRYLRKDLIKDQRGRSEQLSSPIPVLAEVLREKGLSDGRIGLEKMHFPALRYEELKESMPSAKFVACESLFNEARMIKTPAEIQHLQQASITTLKAIQAGFLLAKPGDTPRRVANQIGGALDVRGADSRFFLELDGMADGKRFDFLGEPIQLKQGDIIRVDAGGVFAGYLSDVARMAVVEKISPEYQSTYQRLILVQKKLIEQIIKPGLTGSELFRQTEQAFQNVGLKVPWGMIVHGIGMDIHERPWIREMETYTFEPNMTLMVEVYNHGPGGKIQIQIEDLVLVTEKGAKVLSTFGSTEQPFIIE